MSAIDAFDVLMYVFDTWGDKPQAMPVDADVLEQELEKAGFPTPEIDKALRWLGALDDDDTIAIANIDESCGVRVFAPQEMAKLDEEARGFIGFMDRSGVWTPTQREQVLDRIMMLEAGTMDAERLQWIALMSFSDRPEHAKARQWIEDLIYDHSPDSVH